MTISSDILINCTNRYEYFKVKLLEHKFRPRFVLEDLSYIKQDLFMSFPMVCFCDIKEKEIISHLDRYGSFGIGLSREWGIENGLSCLCYLPNEPNGSSHSGLFKSIQSLISSGTASSKDKLYLYNIIRYLKRFDGIQKSSFSGKNEAVRFYDEREWRYIPEYDPTNSKSVFFLDKKSHNDKAILKKANDYAYNEPISFMSDDIQSIVVPDNYYRDRVVSEILKNGGSNFVSQEYQRLSLLIKTKQEILTH